MVVAWAPLPNLAPPSPPCPALPSCQGADANLAAAAIEAATLLPSRSCAVGPAKAGSKRLGDLAELGAVVPHGKVPKRYEKTAAEKAQWAWRGHRTRPHCCYPAAIALAVPEVDPGAGGTLGQASAQAADPRIPCALHVALRVRPSQGPCHGSSKLKLQRKRMGMG
mmetsp:Transcript_3721/g.8031  ORF Transcript_3721/g.8031 Transcript_3721/m.8031 type:complete len:166 (+) Transcript_3721:1029-1526(+)